MANPRPIGLGPLKYYKRHYSRGKRDNAIFTITVIYCSDTDLSVGVALQHPTHLERTLRRQWTTQKAPCPDHRTHLEKTLRQWTTQKAPRLNHPTHSERTLRQWATQKTPRLNHLTHLERTLRQWTTQKASSQRNSPSEGDTQALGRRYSGPWKEIFRPLEEDIQALGDTQALVLRS